MQEHSASSGAAHWEEEVQAFHSQSTSGLQDPPAAAASPQPLQSAADAHTAQPPLSPWPSTPPHAAMPFLPRDVSEQVPHPPMHPGGSSSQGGSTRCSGSGVPPASSTPTPGSGAPPRSTSGAGPRAPRARRGSVLSFFMKDPLPDPGLETGSEDGPAESKTSPNLNPYRNARASLDLTARLKSVSSFFTGSMGKPSTGDGEESQADHLMSPGSGRRSGRSKSVTNRPASRRMSMSMVDTLFKVKSFSSMLLGRSNTEQEPEYESEPDASLPLTFSSLEDFMPLQYRYHQGRHTESWFACAVKTGEHHILKKYFKAKMGDIDLVRVRKALQFSQDLEHDNIVKVKGFWETEDFMYIVEEYVVRGDLLQDSMSHPERYTEQFVCRYIVAPLLSVLVYLHSHQIYHRSLYPENLLLGRANKLHLGHFTNAVDAKLDAANERLGFLDYMAPEMLSIKVSTPSSWLIKSKSFAAGASSIKIVPTSEPQSHPHTHNHTPPPLISARATASISGPVPPSTSNPQLASSKFTSASGAQLSSFKEAAGLALIKSLSKGKGLFAFRGAEDSSVSPAHTNAHAGARPSGGSSSLIVPCNSWEWQETYDEKVDIWQVGCMVHEMLCGSLPFETDNQQLACALILWAEVNYWPDTLSPQCNEFMKMCLSKDPKKRPSAEELLQHPWVLGHVAGESMLSVRELKEAVTAEVPAPKALHWGDTLYSWWSKMFGFGEREAPAGPADKDKDKDKEHGGGGGGSGVLKPGA